MCFYLHINGNIAMEGGATYSRTKTFGRRFKTFRAGTKAQRVNQKKSLLSAGAGAM